MPGDDRADRRHRHTGAAAACCECFEPMLGNRAQDLVIVAAGQSASRCQRRRAPAAPAAAGDSGTRGASMAADTPDAAQSLARSPARPSDTSIAARGVVAHGLGQRVARLRHAIARRPASPCRGIAGQRRGDRAALEDVEARARHRRSCPSPPRGRRAWRRCDGPSCPRARGRTR